MSKRSSLFDFTKFIMIVFVIVTHIGWSDFERKNFLFPYFIDMAVPIFLLISAYLRSDKIERIGLKNSYRVNEIIKTLISLLLAYFIVVIIEIFAIFVGFKMGFDVYIDKLSSFNNFVKWIITGASGPGSYYVPIMLQLIAFFPLVYILFRKNKYFGIVASFIVNLLYELLAFYFDIGSGLYRLLIFRYTFILGLGIFLYQSKDYKKIDSIFAIIMFVIGLAYITINHYFFPFPLFQAWKSTSMLCGPYAFGIMYFIMKYCHHMKYIFLCEIGKASYHIYLTQMVYYAFLNPLLVNKIYQINNIFLVPLNLILCIGFGYLFYIIEVPIRKKIIKSVL